MSIVLFIAILMNVVFWTIALKIEHKDATSFVQSASYLFQRHPHTTIDSGIIAQFGFLKLGLTRSVEGFLLKVATNESMRISPARAIPPPMTKASGHHACNHGKSLAEVCTRTLGQLQCNLVALLRVKHVLGLDVLHTAQAGLGLRVLI